MISYNSRIFVWLYERINSLLFLRRNSKAKRFYSQFQKVNGLYFDIGANRGNTIKPFIDKGMNIIAVEPQIECAKYLKLRFGNKVTVINKGVGYDVNPRKMYISNHSVLSSFSKEWISVLVEGEYFSSNTWNKEREIEMTTLNKLIECYGMPDFIKIDIEGYELEALNGLSKEVNLLSFEYTVPELLKKVTLCLERLIKIYHSNFMCNYSSEESMKLLLKDWVTPDEMINVVLSSNEFLSSRLGDIYIKKHL